MTDPAEIPLFVYGSLTFPEVLHVLLARTPRMVPAVAGGWRNATLRERPFPGLVPGNSRVAGMLLLDLCPEELDLIDLFEGPMYAKQVLSLDENRQGWAYVCVDESLVHATDWDRQAFAAAHLPTYLEKCAGWAARQTPMAGR
ncbi:gamma-glutamylcyclotransferase family protein [Nocardia sp. NPDC050175]|uniref:gamma-glutamylcyclotransferase family protein n=1 Tax=Nocardia sp. NPDC050175 TaxID=3364317 RepID=UPI0037B07FA3